MKQYTYVINDDFSLEDVARQISDQIHRNPHVTSVLQVIESSGTEEIVRYGYEKASKWFPDMIPPDGTGSVHLRIRHQECDPRGQT